MTIHVHDLWGCTPTPLAHYLKALGVLRLVAAQQDPAARLWWQDEHARLATSLSADALVEFFAVAYQPTPILDPWNGGSGFYDEVDKGLTPIERSTAARLEEFRRVVAAIRADMTTSGIVEARLEMKRLEKAEGAEAKARHKEAKARFDGLKAEFLPRCRQQWRGGAIEWLESAVVIGADGEPAYPAIFGSGGNDGRLDFTNNLMQRLGDLFELASDEARPRPGSRARLRAALFGDRALSGLPSNAIGQFHPGVAGGANSGVGFEGKGITNPWDFVLMIEGGVCLRAGLTRRASTESLPQAAAPFALRNDSTGFGTAAEGESSPRGEQWLPLWSAPSTIGEVSAFFAEARMQVGDRCGQRPVDAARAIGRLGVARGVAAFERVGYLERNGQSNFAVPLGRFRVQAQPRRELVDHVADWLSRFSAKARADGAPTSWRRAARMTEEALLAVCRQGHDPQRWRALAVALADADAALARTAAKAAQKGVRPLDRLPAGWLEALPNCAALRLALAFASQGGRVRRHHAPVERGRYVTTGGPDLVATTGDFVRDAVALVCRRLRTEGAAVFPLRGRDAFSAAVSDVAAFLAGDLDEALLAAYARFLCALDWDAARPVESAPGDGSLAELAAYSLLRLSHMPGPLTLREGVVEIRGEAGIVDALLAGRITAAAAMCQRRLRIAGLRPHATRFVLDPGRARRLVASLCFPVSPGTARRLAERLTKTIEPSTQE